MKIKKRDLKILIESLLTEKVARGSGSTYSYERDPDGIYSAFKASLDPYKYKVHRIEYDGIVVKIMGAPTGRESAIGATFKINKDNVTNPNVQLLFDSMRFLDEKVLESDFYQNLVATETYDHGSSQVEYINMGAVDDKVIEGIIEKQYQNIIDIGRHEAPDTTLKSISPDELNSSIINAVTAVINGAKTTSEKSLDNITVNIENSVEIAMSHTSEVVSIYYQSIDFGDAQTQQTTREDVRCVWLLMKTGADEYSYSFIDFKEVKYEEIPALVHDQGKIQTTSTQDTAVTTSTEAEDVSNTPASQQTPEDTIDSLPTKSFSEGRPAQNSLNQNSDPDDFMVLRYTGDNSSKSIRINLLEGGEKIRVTEGGFFGDEKVAKVYTMTAEKDLMLTTTGPLDFTIIEISHPKDAQDPSIDTDINIQGVATTKVGKELEDDGSLKKIDIKKFINGFERKNDFTIKRDGLAIKFILEETIDYTLKEGLSRGSLYRMRYRRY